MKLYIKEKVFSWGDQFTVMDELGNDKYIVKGEVFSWGKSFTSITWQEMKSHSAGTLDRPIR